MTNTKENKAYFAGMYAAESLDMRIALGLTTEIFSLEDAEQTEKELISMAENYESELWKCNEAGEWEKIYNPLGWCTEDPDPYFEEYPEELELLEGVTLDGEPVYKRTHSKLVQDEVWGFRSKEIITYEVWLTHEGQKYWLSQDHLEDFLGMVVGSWRPKLEII